MQKHRGNLEPRSPEVTLGWRNSRNDPGSAGNLHLVPAFDTRDPALLPALLDLRLLVPSSSSSSSSSFSTSTCGSEQVAHVPEFRICYSQLADPSAIPCAAVNKGFICCSPFRCKYITAKKGIGGQRGFGGSGGGRGFGGHEGASTGNQQLSPLSEYQRLPTERPRQHQALQSKEEAKMRFRNVLRKLKSRNGPALPAWEYLHGEPLCILEKIFILHPRHLFDEIHALLPGCKLIIMPGQLLREELPCTRLDRLRILLGEAHLLRHVDARPRQRGCLTSQRGVVGSETRDKTILRHDFRGRIREPALYSHRGRCNVFFKLLNAALA